MLIYKREEFKHCVLELNFTRGNKPYKQEYGRTQKKKKKKIEKIIKIKIKLKEYKERFFYLFLFFNIHQGIHLLDGK